MNKLKNEINSKENYYNEQINSKEALYHSKLQENERNTIENKRMKLEYNEISGKIENLKKTHEQQLSEKINEISELKKIE